MSNSAVKTYLYKAIRKYRYSYYLKLLNPTARTLIDLGCRDHEFVQLVKRKGYEAIGTDIENDIHVTQSSADIITCFQVLEHIEDPLKAVKNIAKLCYRQLIISVPNEPWFSLFRLSWEPEHLWAITPMILKRYLGPPTHESFIFFKRYYVGVWER